MGEGVMERRDEIVQLRQAGLTYGQIASKLGISKARVRQIFKGKQLVKKPELDAKIMLTTAEASKLLGIHVNTVRRWSEKGILRAYRISSRGDRRFRREDIDRFLKERQIAG